MYSKTINANLMPTMRQQKNNPFITANDRNSRQRYNTQQKQFPHAVRTYTTLVAIYWLATIKLEQRELQTNIKYRAAEGAPTLNNSNCGWETLTTQFWSRNAWTVLYCFSIELLSYTKYEFQTDCMKQKTPLQTKLHCLLSPIKQFL